MRGLAGFAAVLGILALPAAILCAAPGIADEPMVVISRPGTVFHKADSGDLRGRGHERTLAHAVAAGYTPCHVCFAPEAKTSRAVAGNFAGATAAASTAMTTSIGSILATTTASGTFGLRQGVSELSGGLRGAIRDPYADLSTILNPGQEQGAYDTCSACSPGK